MDNKYTLFAYKPDSCDMCRGCLVASYGSDCKLFVAINREQLIEQWAMLKAHELDHSEVGYCVTVTVVFNNTPVVVYSDNGIDYREHWNYDDIVDARADPDSVVAFDQLFDHLADIQAEVGTKAQQIKSQIAAALAEYHNQQAAMQAQVAQDRERKQLAALLAKYPQHEPNPTI